jgi:hypothetical protein
MSLAHLADDGKMYRFGQLRAVKGCAVVQIGKVYEVPTDLQIFDGTKFVAFVSEEGTAVFNKMMDEVLQALGAK